MIVVSLAPLVPPQFTQATAVNLEIPCPSWSILKCSVTVSLGVALSGFVLKTISPPQEPSDSALIVAYVGDSEALLALIFLNFNA